jgi:hypothetical protein
LQKKTTEFYRMAEAITENAQVEDAKNKAE